MQRTKDSNELKIIFEKKALINTYFGKACEYVTVKDLEERQCPLMLSFVGNASGREKLYKNGKPYVVSVFQRKEDARVGGLFPVTTKAKCISFNFVNHRLQLTIFVQSIGGSFWALFPGRKS